MKSNIEILIIKFLRENSTEDEKKELLSWYNASDEHKKEFIELLSLWNATHPPFVPEDINMSEAKKKISKQVKISKPTKSRKIVMWWQQIAAFLLLPSLALTAYLLSNTQSELKLTKQTITAMPGTRTEVNLPDGSLVWLNSGSSLSYSIPFQKENRKVNLSGEGYFSVKSDKKNPFSIITSKINVLVTGTELNVEAYPKDSISQVTLVKGVASVKISEEKNILLAPDTQVQVNTLSRSHKLKEIDARLYAKWKDGILVFRDEPLENIFKRIGRTFNVKIAVKDSLLSKQLYRATFKNESLTQILNAIQISVPIRYNYLEIKNQTSESIEVYFKK